VHTERCLPGTWRVVQPPSVAVTGNEDADDGRVSRAIAKCMPQ
jgi:hypothetical protein